jgi:hypothetical protein
MIWERVLKPAPKKIIFLSFNFVLFALFSFEKRSGERSLTSFEMTDIVIPSVMRGIFPQAFSLPGDERKIMNHFVVRCRCDFAVAASSGFDSRSQHRGGLRFDLELIAG